VCVCALTYGQRVWAVWPGVSAVVMRLRSGRQTSGQLLPRGPYL